MVDKEKNNISNTEIGAEPNSDIDDRSEENSTELENDLENGNNHLAVNDKTNTHLRRLISNNYIEYASYVIKERAIPDINDGFKPVQRRIMWSLYRMDDGKFNKVANIVGNAMQYHPHGDASIYQALVHLANKDYFIEKQGNFGNIFTGDVAAAGRYIEARLTPLAKETIFNSDITSFVDSYDGRNKEPVCFPSKIPALLMSGQEGIAPGMTTMILPHNFNELLNAQIAILKEESFEVFPDFIQGGIMDVSEYNDGNGKITLRAKIELVGRKLMIREIPAMTTTEKLIASIEKAVSKNKLKITSINDYTAEHVEIEIVPARGYSPEKAIKALYTYTDCSLSISSSILVIKDNRPQVLSVSEVLKYNTEKLLNYLKEELIIELGKLNESFHEKTLERIFIENRIYKRIEECETYELVLSEIRDGLNKFIDLLKREITDKDIEKLIAIPIRRISKFDINKNKKDIDGILEDIAVTEKNLKAIKNYTIDYIKNLIKKYGSDYPRRTEIEELEEVDKKAAALNNIKVGWDRKNCYIGTGVKSDETVMCNEFDHLVSMEKSGRFKVQSIPQKLYAGRLFYFGKYKKDNVFSIVYKEKKREIYFVKRCCIEKFIRDKQYSIVPSGCQLELITTRDNSIYECELAHKKRSNVDLLEIDFSTVQLRAVGARGFKLTDRKILKFKFKGVNEDIPSDNKNDNENENLTKAIPKPTESVIDKKQIEKIKRPEPEIVEKTDAEKIPPELSEKIKVEPPEHESLVHDDIIAEIAISEEDDFKLEFHEEKRPGKKSKSVTEAVKEELKEKYEQKVAKKSEEKAEKQPEAKPPEENKKNEMPQTSDISDDEDWGIIQPDLGF